MTTADADLKGGTALLDGASPEVVASTAVVLDAVRSARCTSRPEIVEETDLGKALVTERVRTLRGWGVLRERGQLASRGGRRAQRLQFAADLGFVLAVEIGMTHIAAAAMDLAGAVLASRRHSVEMRSGPDEVLSVVEVVLDELQEACERRGHGTLCGIGVGVAGPVEFATGKTAFPPVHPAWHDQPIRDRLATRFGAPAWVDNEVNLMALAEVRDGAALGHENALVFKMGSWVGAGLVSNGQLHRGALGCAGSLVTAAGGDAIALEGSELARNGDSPALADLVAEGQQISAQSVAACAQAGDVACQSLLDSAAEDIGKVMAVVVDFFNPSLVVVGGGMTHGGDAFLAKVRQTVYGSAIALATRDLQIVRSALGEQASVIGAGLMTLDEIFATARLPDTIARIAEAAPAHAGSLR